MQYEDGDKEEFISSQLKKKGLTFRSWTASMPWPKQNGLLVSTTELFLIIVSSMTDW